MAFDVALRWSAARRENKPLLTIPCLDELRNPNCESLVGQQLRECAQIVKEKGELYRWKKHAGLGVLVIWNSVSKTFIGFDNALFCRWLGEHFDLADKTGMNFGAPHASVASQLWETLLHDSTDLPWASWQLTDEWRKAGR